MKLVRALNVIFCLMMGAIGFYLFGQFTALEGRQSIVAQVMHSVGVQVGQIHARVVGAYDYTEIPNLEVGVNQATGTAGNLRVGNGTPDVALNGEDLYVEGTSEFDGATRHDGAVTNNSTVANNGAVTNASTVANNSSVTWGSASSEIATFSSITVTTTTKGAINVTGKRFVTLNTGNNFTGLNFVGVPGQIVTLRSGVTGTNTLQIDDTTSVGLTGNLVLTASAAYTGDSVTLLCVSTDADGNEWSELSASIN